MKLIPDRFRKAIGDMIFPSSGLNSFLRMPRTGYDFSRQVDGYQSAIIMACVNWIMRTYPEAPLFLRKRNADGSWDDNFEHPMLTLLDSPNPYYDGLLLQAATIADYNIDGNAYWRKIRSAAGRVVELWWVPSPYIEPAWGLANHLSNQYITHYEYNPGGLPESILPEDIVHFRYGLDPKNTRKGLSPLKSLFREVFTDDEAANMTAALLKNQGVPGIVISPKEGSLLNKEVAIDIKEFFKENTTGDKRGEPLVMSGATSIEQFGFNPQQMILTELRRLPEERISGVLGVPAIVAGLGAGLARSTFANMQEAREMAYESNIIPSQRTLGSVIKRQLLTDFEDDVMPWQVAYDLSEVRVLQEDENKKAERVTKMVMGGFVTVADAQRETSMPVDETQNIYLRGLQLIEVTANQPERVATDGDDILDIEETPISLTGVQIEAAQSIIRNLIDGLLPPAVALELLVAVGIPRDKAKDMVEASTAFTPTVPQEEVIAGQDAGDKSLKAGGSWNTKLSPAEWEALYSAGDPHWATSKDPSIFAQEFVKELQEKKTKTILEVGSGNGRDSIFFYHAGLDVTAIDVSPSAVELAKENAKEAEAIVDFQVGNAEEMSFSDNQFGAVFSLSVLHSTDLSKSISEIQRVLMKKGLAFIYLYGDTQFADGKREEHITVDGWLELLKSLNFTIINFYSEQDETFDEFGEKHQLLISLIEKEG